MNLLLDSQLLIWTARETARLPPAARLLIADAGNVVHFSAASIWEVAIKHGRGRPEFDFEPRRFRMKLIDEGFVEMPITGEHTILVAGLPAIHKDPFDRLLVAQAMAESLTLLTADRLLARYPGPIRRV